MKSATPPGGAVATAANGTTGKTVLTDVGKVDLAVSRDRNGSFEPQIARKGQARLFSLGTLDAVEDLVGVLGPGERPRVVAPVAGEGADGAGELADESKAAAADRLAGDDREEALHQVEPGAAGGHEVQGDPLAGGRPSQARMSACLCVA